MPHRIQTACNAADGLRSFARSAASVPALVGFDGFVDSIIHVVDKRHDENDYTPIHTIDHFGHRVLAAAGQSANFELVTLRQKLGGNGPIMANALAAAGLQVTYVGSVGDSEPHPAFQELAQHAEVHPVLAPGTTDALEFHDGKLMLGKYDHLAQLNYQRLCQTLGQTTFDRIVARSRLLGMVNWTMLPELESIWQHLNDRLLPEIGPEVQGHRRLLFIDLADPEKRAHEDLQRALQHCRRLNQHADVVLGMNLKEARQVATALGLQDQADPAAAEALACSIRDRMDLHCVVVHPRTGAAAAMATPDGIQSAHFHGPFTRTPLLSTGAGDNFNAGFCLGRLANLPVDQCLCAGTATSGYYVRHGFSPDLHQLADFCDALPEPEPA